MCAIWVHYSQIILWHQRNSNLPEQVQSQVSTTDVIGYERQTAPISAGFAKRRGIWRCPDRSRQTSVWIIPDAFYWLLSFNGETAYRTCLNSMFDFVEEDRKEQWDYNPSRYTVSSSVPQFFFNRNFFISYCCKLSILHHLQSFFFIKKKAHFCWCYVRAENNVWKCGHRNNFSLNRDPQKYRSYSRIQLFSDVLQWS